MIVAMGVLTILMAILLQATGVVSSAWKSGLARVDSESQVRTIMSLVNRDVQSLVLRRDLPAFVDSTGAPAFAFYTQVTGGNGRRQLSLVEYFVNTSTPAQFVRAHRALDFVSSPSNPDLSLGNTNLPDTSSFHPTVAAPSEYEALSEGIIMFKWQGLNASGAYANSYVYNYNAPSDSGNTRAVVVSLLILDSAAYRVASRTGSLDLLKSKFTGSPASTQTYAQYWNTLIDSPTFGTDLPLPVRAGVRAFDLHVPLPTAISAY